MLKLGDLQFMSIGGNCVYLACFDRKTRLKGPLDNVNLKSVNGLRLAIDGGLYDFVKNNVPQKRHKEPGEYRDGDCEWETLYPDKTICFVHNVPEGDRFFEEFKTRCDRLSKFLADVRENDGKWLTFTLNGNFVKYFSGELVGDNLANALSYLSEVGLLRKTLIIGSRVISSDYKVFDHHLCRASFDKIKKSFPRLNYIELNDVNAWEPEGTIKQFKEKIPKFVESILSRKD